MAVGGVARVLSGVHGYRSWCDEEQRLRSDLSQDRDIWPREWVKVVRAAQIHCYPRLITPFPGPSPGTLAETSLRPEMGSGLMQCASIYLWQLRIA
jgi:hypothetical protein